LEIVQLVIQNAVEKNPGNNFGNTPLHLAATHGHLEVCRLILENTSDCSPENNFGKTPLEFAHKNGHTEVCKFLEDKFHSLNICTQ
jgi:ankyrin repeat protein